MRTIINRPAEPAPVVKPKGPRMNRSEQAYAMRLEAMKRNGMIDDYAFEAVTLKLAHDTRYTPDFIVWKRWPMADHEGGTVEFHEVKGHMRDDARVKLHVAARQTPWATFYLCKLTKGAWTITEVDRG